MPIDHYVYPGTIVLKNKLNITDENHLKLAEADITLKRMAELRQNPVKGSFDLKHLQKIHQYIFQDIYDWAGKIRNVDIAKSVLFCPVRNLNSYSQTVFNNLKKENHLKELDVERFISRAAYHLGEINMMHPFREGNGRSQREFMRELALAAGYELSLENVSRQKMIEISIQSANVNNTGLEWAIRNNIKPVDFKEKILAEIEKSSGVKKLFGSPGGKTLFYAYAKDVLSETGKAWTDKTNELIVEKMLKNDVPLQHVKNALSYSPEKMNDVSRFVSEIENKPEIKDGKSRGMEL